MKNRQLSKKIFVFAVLWSCITSAGDVLYSDLKMLTYDDMLAKVKTRVMTAEKVAGDDIEDAKKELFEALQIILARPNTDNMVSQLIPVVRTPLKNLETWESSMAEIAQTSLATLKSKNAKAPQQATALITLENIMSELKPDVKSNKAVKEIFKSIQKSEVVVSDSVKSEFRLRGSMKPPAPPQEIATRVLSSAK